ncbi:hypothetical protein [Azoarcus indigens]|uniref:hypothetical protein n=1 Tax=Azoarcus indigens TaxID=29545 RepID=UPI001B7D0808|nr:hypothetical protein [Azoarcus indigens]
MDKKALSERDICTRFITPAIAAGGWRTDVQMREEVNLTDGRVVVRGNKAHRRPAGSRTICFTSRPRPTPGCKACGRRQPGGCELTSWAQPWPG